MSKALAIAQPPAIQRRLHHVRQFHQAAMMAASQTTAAAIFTGLELLAVQKELKKSHGDTFEQWLSKHAEELGFSRPTAFRYTALAHGMQKRMGEIEPLLDFAPSDLNAEQQKRLLKAMHKSVDGETLQALYLDFGIIKPQRRLPHNPNPANNGSGEDGPVVTPQEIIAEQLDLFTKATSAVERTIEVDGVQVLWITHLKKAEFDAAYLMAKRQFDLFEAARKARK